jgi:hypothetical protein
MYRIILILSHDLFFTLPLQFIILKSLSFLHYTMVAIHTVVRITTNKYNYKTSNNLHASTSCILAHIKKMHTVKDPTRLGIFHPWYMTR